MTLGKVRLLCAEPSVKPECPERGEEALATA